MPNDIITRNEERGVFAIDAVDQRTVSNDVINVVLSEDAISRDGGNFTNLKVIVSLKMNESDRNIVVGIEEN